MTLRLLALLLLLALPAAAQETTSGDWRSTLTPLTPGSSTVALEGEGVYRFAWSGFKAAEAMLRFSHPSPERRRLDIEAATLGTARRLWRFDVTYFSTVDARTLLPERVRQLERYRKKTVAIASEFTPSKAYRTKGPLKKNDAFWKDRSANHEKLETFTGTQAKRFRYPDLLDAHSALLFLRTQPLENGSRLRFVIFQDSTYLATVTVIRREALILEGKRYSAIRLDLSLQWLDEKLILQPHRRFKKATGWLSDDEKRLLLKVESELFIGSISAELTRWDDAKAAPPKF